ncbi:exonuclease domain-containing protein [Denitratisoma sp. agr-D3]
MGTILNGLTARRRFWLALILLGFLMTGPFLLTATVLLLDMPAEERQTLIQVLQHRMPIGVVLTMAGFAVGAALLRHLFEQYVTGLHRMAEHLRLMLGANRDFRVTPEGPPEVQELARAANELAQQRDSLLLDVEQQIAAAKSSVESERNRLAALMSELAMGVIVCNLDGRILLYNQRARSQFGVGLPTGAACPTLALGRSIYALLDRKRLAHGLALIEQRLRGGNLHPVTHFVITLREGRLLHLHMAPVLAGGDTAPAAISGYVLTVEDITRRFERDVQRNHAFHTLTAGQRSQLGHMAEGGDGALKRALADIQAQFDRDALALMDTLKSPWPLEDIPAADLVAALVQGLAAHTSLSLKPEPVAEPLWVQADSYALIEAVVFLAQRLEDQYELRELRLALHDDPADPGRASLDLIWSGTPMSSETLFTWELDPVAGSDADALTLRQVMERHGGTLRFLHDSAAHRRILRLSLPLAAPPAAEALRAGNTAGSSRPEYYDFNLFDFHHEGVDLEQKLTALACTAFDTETTGLEPSKGDEIIQIGAVHLLNGRLIAQETFDQLVNPGFPIKPEGIPIHGITDDMVRHQPGIDAVLPNFHGFCADTVLIGHNAAFDMRFLQLKEARSGLRFSQPVLDTLLLSTLIHPGQESHRLEAIAERLGIPLGQRHNALADALMTGQLFLRMLPLLADKGIVTLGQALEASEKCWHARLKY